MTEGQARFGPLVIAHRGASGYLPEHTLPAKALAYGLGADFIEQDVVASRDNQLIVLHDIHLDRVTDVAERFPDRARADGRWYVRDFDLAELRTLIVRERRNEEGAAAFPGRFPAQLGRFGIATLGDEIEMIQGLNKATGRNVGIYPEIKRPAWHHGEGVDLAGEMLEVLGHYGYWHRADAAYVQCFDAAETRRLRDELASELRLVQLVAENDWGESATDYDAMKSRDGIAAVAEYADGLGPWLGQIYTVDGDDGLPQTTGLVELAHEHGLTVHPFTFRADALGPGFDSYASMVRWFAETLVIDGLFTDFADLTLAALEGGRPD